MVNVIPITALTNRADDRADEICCAFCHERFEGEATKLEHLERAHPDWAGKIMSGFLRQIPRMNG